MSIRRVAVRSGSFAFMDATMSVRRVALSDGVVSDMVETLRARRFERADSYLRPDTILCGIAVKGGESDAEERHTRILERCLPSSAPI